MKTISLKKALEIYGASNIEIHKGFKYRFGFFEKDNQLYYFNRNIDGECCDTLMIRTAEHRKDFHGGSNQFIEGWFEDRGYKIHVPATKTDFNNM